jgi:hypothetical protein
MQVKTEEGIVESNLSQEISPLVNYIFAKVEKRRLHTELLSTSTILLFPSFYYKYLKTKKDF